MRRAILQMLCQTSINDGGLFCQALEKKITIRDLMTSCKPIGRREAQKYLLFIEATAVRRFGLYINFCTYNTFITNIIKPLYIRMKFTLYKISVYEICPFLTYLILHD